MCGVISLPHLVNIAFCSVSESVLLVCLCVAWVYPTRVRLMPFHFFIETENEKDDLFLSENVLFRKREHAEWREREGLRNHLLL